MCVYVFQKCVFEELFEKDVTSLSTVMNSCQMFSGLQNKLFNLFLYGTDGKCSFFKHSLNKHPRGSRSVSFCRDLYCKQCAMFAAEGKAPDAEKEKKGEEDCEDGGKVSKKGEKKWHQPDKTTTSL